MIPLARPQAQVYVPDGVDLDSALSRTTHLGIGAHADDLEFMAWYPIIHCYEREDAWFTAITVSDGRGSPREGEYADVSDDGIREVRLREQREAARLGRYGALLCLDYPSDDIRERGNQMLRAELQRLAEACTPDMIFTHNPADRHDTHAALSVAVVDAVREGAHRPGKLYGCEVWRGLDWLTEPDKTRFDVSGGIALMEKIMAVYESQIAGGKRYDAATMGRKRANATYLMSHAVDEAEALEYALDMTALLEPPYPSIREFMRGCVGRFAHDVEARLERYT